MLVLCQNIICRYLALISLSGLNLRIILFYTTNIQSLIHFSPPNYPGQGLIHRWHELTRMRILGHSKHKVLQRLQPVKRYRHLTCYLQWWGYWGPEKWGNLLKVTPLVMVKLRIWTQAWSSGPGAPNHDPPLTPHPMSCCPWFKELKATTFCL